VNVDGSFDWQRQLNYAFNLVDAQSVRILAACLVEPILSSDGVVNLPLVFFTTHVSDPLVAAVGNTVLDVFGRDQMDPRLSAADDVGALWSSES
jgi:hypothetical protein